MKVAPPSADLLIKLALGAAVVWGGFYLVNKAKGAAGAAIDDLMRQAGQAADYVIEGVNPVNPNNVINRGVTAIGAGFTGDINWTLGGAIYDSTHDAAGSFQWPAVPTVLSFMQPAVFIGNAIGNTIRNGSAPSTTAQYDAMGNYMGEY